MHIELIEIYSIDARSIRGWGRVLYLFYCKDGKHMYETSELETLCFRDSRDMFTLPYVDSKVCLHQRLIIAFKMFQTTN